MIKISDRGSVKELLERTTLSNDEFNDFLDKLSLEYSTIGMIQEVIPITKGYEDANFQIITKSGKYVLKVFAEDMSYESAYAHAEILKHAKISGVSCIEILENNNREMLTVIDDTYCFLTKFIEGNTYENLEIDNSTIIFIANELLKLNKLDLDLTVSYDSWGNSEFLWEYKRNKDLVNLADLKVIKETVMKARVLDMRGYKKGIIHGDIQPKHVIKTDRGPKIIDFGVARRDYLVFEISTFLAWFCLYSKEISDYDDIINAVLRVYSSYIPITEQVQKTILTLIEVAYASYYYKTSILISSGDTSEETIAWKKLALDLLTKWRRYITSELNHISK